MNDKPKIPTAAERAKALVEEERRMRKDGTLIRLYKEAAKKRRRMIREDIEKPKEP